MLIRVIAAYVLTVHVWGGIKIFHLGGKMHAMLTCIVSLDLRSPRLALAESFPGGRYVVTHRGNQSQPCYNYTCHIIPPDLQGRREAPLEEWISNFS